MYPRSGPRALSSIQHHALELSPPASQCRSPTHTLLPPSDYLHWKSVSSTPSILCPSDHLHPPTAPFPLVHPTSYGYPNNGFATRSHVAFRLPWALFSIPHPSSLTTISRECQMFATSAHPATIYSCTLHSVPAIVGTLIQPTNHTPRLPPTLATKSLCPSHIALIYYAHPCTLHITIPRFLAVVQQ